VAQLHFSIIYSAIRTLDLLQKTNYLTLLREEWTFISWKKEYPTYMGRSCGYLVS
jgi:hypothetical protein